MSRIRNTGIQVPVTVQDYSNAFTAYDSPLTVVSLAILGSCTKLTPLEEPGGGSPVVTYFRHSMMVVFPHPFYAQGSQGIKSIPEHVPLTLRFSHGDDLVGINGLIIIDGTLDCPF
jgi:hypothetical protein